MTGKSYYITTVADWQRHAHRFAQSHWIELDLASTPSSDSVVACSRPAPTGGDAAQASTSGRAAAGRILVLVEADEGVHLALEDDAAFEALPHPLAQKPISTAAQSALAPHGVPSGVTTFDAAEALARLHPLLKHRVF
jgi:hypothetical protein